MLIDGHRFKSPWVDEDAVADCGALVLDDQTGGPNGLPANSPALDLLMARATVTGTWNLPWAVAQVQATEAATGVWSDGESLSRATQWHAAFGEPRMNEAVWVVAGLAVGGMASLMTKTTKLSSILFDVLTGSFGAVAAAWFAFPVEARLWGPSAFSPGSALVAMLGATFVVSLGRLLRG